MKKLPCNPGQSYVQNIVARAGNDESFPNTSQNCQILGRWNPADGLKGKSWTSGETGSKWVALYQCKAKCPHKTCARIVIRTMEKDAVPEINPSSQFSGNSISISKKLPNCIGDVPLKYAGSITTNEAITEQASYTFSKEISHSFDSTIEADATVEATVGFKMFGEDAEAGTSRSIKASTSAGFTKAYTKGQTQVTQTVDTNAFTATVKYTVAPGEVAFVTADVTQFDYTTKFIAQADCVDESGDVIESTKLDGVFHGRTYETDDNTKVTSRPCYSDECSCAMCTADDDLNVECA